jgi:hypothetical protein
MLHPLRRAPLSRMMPLNRFVLPLLRAFIPFPRANTVALSAFPAYEFDFLIPSDFSIVEKSEIKEEKQKSSEQDQKNFHHGRTSFGSRSRNFKSKWIFKNSAALFACQDLISET